MKTYGLFAVGLGVVAVLGGCQEDVSVDTHDTVRAAFRRGAALADSPFGGTAVIELTLEYDACFKAFYDLNPNYVLDGVDGAPIFGGEELGGEGWQDRLCNQADPGLVQCTVASYQQVLETGVAPSLTVRYAVTGEVEDRELIVGPLPTTELADCEGGVTPRVRLTGARGLGAGDTPIWRKEDGGDQAGPGQELAMDVSAGPA